MTFQEREWSFWRRVRPLRGELRRQGQEGQ